MKMKLDWVGDFCFYEIDFCGGLKDARPGGDIYYETKDDCLKKMDLLAIDGIYGKAVAEDILTSLRGERRRPEDRGGIWWGAEASTTWAATDTEARDPLDVTMDIPFGDPTDPTRLTCNYGQMVRELLSEVSDNRQHGHLEPESIEGTRLMLIDIKSALLSLTVDIDTVLLRIDKP